MPTPQVPVGEEGVEERVPMIVGDGRVPNAFGSDASYTGPGVSS